MAQAKGETFRIAVVGGGFGGLEAVRKLRGSGAEITLIDQRNHHLFQPLLYQVATTVLPTSEIAWPLRQIFRGRKDVTTLLAKVQAVDTDRKTLIFEDGTTHAFDALVLATGARHSYFGRDEWEDVAPGLKTLEDATRIRERVLSAFERAERATDSDEQRRNLTFVVVGAGPTGVEMAGIIADLAQRVLPGEFRRIDTRTSEIVLVEGGDQVLPGFVDGLSSYTRNALEKLGVTVRLDALVTDCHDGGVQLGNEEIEAATVVWAAGVKASAAGEWLEAPQDRAGRVKVETNLTVPGHPDIFVIGDTAAVLDKKGAPVPGNAPAAKQMGSYVAKTLRARLRGGKAPRAFAYKHAGSLATVGRRAAIADFGWIKLKGAVAWWVWGLAHIYFLIGTRSRFVVAWSWLWSYFTGQNSARLITQTR